MTELERKKKILKGDVIDYLSTLLYSYFEDRTPEEILAFSAKSIEYDHWKRGIISANSIIGVESTMSGIDINTYMESFVKDNVLAYRKAIAAQVIAKNYFFGQIDLIANASDYYVMNSTLIDDVELMFNNLISSV